MLGWLSTKLGKLLATAAVVGIILLSVLRIGKSFGKAESENDALQGRLDSHERGQNAFAKEKRETRAATADELLERLRARDGDWM